MDINDLIRLRKPAGAVELDDHEVDEQIKAVPTHYVVTFAEQMTQFLSIPLASLYPVSVAFDNNNAQVLPPSGDGIDMRKFGRIMAHILAGVGAPNNGTAKIIAWWTGSNTNNGSYTAFATNTTVTLNTNNSEATFELRKDQLPTGNRYVKLNVLVPVANMILAASIYGSPAGSYSPANQYDFSTNTALLNRVVY